MPVPDQVRDDGSGIQNLLKFLDSGSPHRCGRNDKFSRGVNSIGKLYWFRKKIPILSCRSRIKSGMKVLASSIFSEFRVNPGMTGAPSLLKLASMPSTRQ
jgi:hypothetical protein